MIHYINDFRGIAPPTHLSHSTKSFIAGKKSHIVINVSKLSSACTYTSTPGHILSHSFFKLASGQLCSGREKLCTSYKKKHTAIKSDIGQDVLLPPFFSFLLTALRRLCSTVPASLAVWNNSSVEQSLQTTHPP